MDRSLIIIIVTVAILVVYLIIVIIMYARKIGLFAPYKPPPLPSNAFYPLDGVRALTPQEQAARKAAYTPQ